MAYTKRNTVRYLFVGGIASAVYLSSWWLGMKAGLSLTTASIVAFAPTWAFKFFLHKFWVFENTDRSQTVLQTLPYALMTLAAFSVYAGGAYGLQYLGVRELVADGSAAVASAIVRFLLFHRLFVGKTPVSQA